MTVFDNSPERRNLNALSISIILYYLAEGKVVDGEFKLGMFNIEFGKTEMLGYAIVIFLFWFLFRYWVVEKDRFYEDYIIELYDSNLITFYRKLFPNNKLEDNINKVILNDLPRLDINTYMMTEKERKSIIGYIMNVVSHGVLLFYKPTLSAYFMPYILFLGAIYFITEKYFFLILFSIFFVWLFIHLITRVLLHKFFYKK